MFYQCHMISPHVLWWSLPSLKTTGIPAGSRGVPIKQGGFGQWLGPGRWGCPRSLNRRLQMMIDTPIGSMGLVYLHKIWHKSMVNVGKYTIHGWDGTWFISPVPSFYVQRHHKSESQRSVEKSTISVLDVPGTLMICFFCFIYLFEFVQLLWKNSTILTIFSALGVRGWWFWSFLQLRWWFGPPVQWFQPKASRKWRWRTVIRTWKMKGWKMILSFFFGMACMERCELLGFRESYTRWILGVVFVFSCWHWVLYVCCHILEDYRLEHEFLGPLGKGKSSTPNDFDFSPENFGRFPIWLAHIFQMGWWKTTSFVSTAHRT